MEPRIAFDAAVADTFDQGLNNSEAIHLDALDTISFADFAAHLSIGSPNSTGLPNEIAFIDQTVPDISDLLNGFDPSVEVVLLDSSRDGVTQIADVLSGRRGVSAIHIVTHGSEAVLELGTAHLTARTMESAYSSEMRTIRDALSEKADILIYGCNFGAGEAGSHAVDVFAKMTGADVAASNDLTGDVALGGDWDLEVKSGSVETATFINAATQTIWHGLLDGSGAATSGTQTSSVQALSPPLVFEHNVGQVDPSIDFLARGSGYTAYFADGDALIDLQNADGSGHIVRLDVVGGHANSVASGENELAAKSNYLVGPDHITDVGNYGAVLYKELYDGIDMRYYGKDRALEYDFIVGPGADASQIRMNLEGAERVEISESGDLVITLKQCRKCDPLRSPCQLPNCSRWLT